MKIPDKIYDVLKWLLIICVPAFITCFSVIVKTWNINIPLDAIVTTISAVATFFGVILGISNVNYNKQNKQTVQ